MALGAALVDKAYPVIKEPTGEKVEGTKVSVPVYGDRFRCRLDLPMGTESEWNGKERQAKRPTLLFAKSDSKGNRVLLSGDQELKIESKQFGTAIYQIVGDPKPLRKRRSIVGWECALSKVKS